MKQKLYGDNEKVLRAQATELCLKEGWRLAKFGSSWMGSGVKVAVLKKRRR